MNRSLGFARDDEEFPSARSIGSGMGRRCRFEKFRNFRKTFTRGYRYPNIRITALSNKCAEREEIMVVRIGRGAVVTSWPE